jgi:hypothetical protein
MRIPLRNRKNPVHRLLDELNGMPSGIKASLPNVGSDNARKAGLIAGAVVGLTAGSAGISSLRRRTEGARDDS